MKIAVVGGSPTWRRGVSATLADAGYTATEMDTLDAWKPGRGGRALVAYIGGAASLESVGEFAQQYPHIPVVAVVAELNVGSFAEAVRAGAMVAIDDGDPVESFATVIETALLGRSAVPETIVRAMASRIPSAPDPSRWLTPDEADWLRELAGGKTVADLADAVGYSEREMFRTLRDTYARIGVRSRTEAIIWATRHGLLEETSAHSSRSVADL
jgi:DNA-binding NarL/FixJ family response regulator